MIVLDTNVVSEASHRSPDRNVEIWLDRQDRSQLFICGPVIMEQAYGAERFLHKTGSHRYLRALDDVVQRRFRNHILEFDGPAPRRAGEIRARREAAGRPISLPDAMIAAICVVHDAALATRNIRDFQGIDLDLVNPFEAGA